MEANRDSYSNDEYANHIAAELAEVLEQRHGDEIREQSKLLEQIQIDTNAVSDKLLEALTCCVMNNPPSTFHQRTGGEFANMGKQNTLSHKDMKKRIIEAYSKQSRKPHPRT